MFASIPLLVYCVAIIFLIGWLARQQDRSHRVTDALLYATIGVGSYVVLLSELMGLLHALRWWPVLIGWVAPLAILCLVGFRQHFFQVGIKTLRQQSEKLLALKQGEGVLVFAGGLIILALFIIALVCPPNNNDSLMYHLPRVAHWAQNGTLSHYSTAYVFQLSNAIWAELVILQTYILSGGDRWATLMQWGIMLLSFAMARGSAQELGVSRRGQILTVIFVLTMPMAILQATSTQNDFVASFWLAALAYLTVRAWKGHFQPNESLAVAGVLGLGTLTKGTFPFFALPFAIWLLVAVWRHLGWRKAMITTALICILGIGLNLGFWWRNYQTFGSPTGPKWWVAMKTLDEYTPGAILANVARNISSQLGTPFEPVNTAMEKTVITLCQQLGQSNCVHLRDHDDFTYRIPLLSNHEDTAGNLLHGMLILISSCILIAIKNNPQRKTINLFMAALLTGYVLFSSVTLWELYGSRFQMPFFVAFAPLFGLVVDFLGHRRLAYGIGVFLLISALPWVLFNRTRPLIGWTPRITAIPSIFQDDRRGLLFANHPEFREPYLLTSKAFLSSGCQRLGLILDSRDAEYPFWALTNAFSNGILIEVIGGYPTELSRYVDPTFTPCAVICTTCGDHPSAAGLPLAYRSHGMTLYLSQDYHFIPPP